MLAGVIIRNMVVRVWRISSSTVCGGTLALLDAGIALTDRVSGVAMGLVTRGDQARVLTDIIGMEDFMGDMDFKLAATRFVDCYDYCDSV